MEQIGERLSFIKPEFVKKPFEVLCHMMYGGMLAVAVRRMNCVAVNFNRTWKEYVDGFGHGSTEYWLGLEHIYQLTTTKNFKLNIIIFSSNGYCQDYYTFKIGPASTNYELILTGYMPTRHQPPGESYCGDAWNFHADNPPTPFSTIDHDVIGKGCPKLMAAGGWFFAGDSNCTNGNINGPHVNLEIFNLWNTSPFPFSSVTSMFLRLVN
ncbi:hypothetical protein SNE40_018788 [Patella caerulea]|uniref:Fibrinogen C-terminal domain-containing protein n=1 Tax=Patella caerulea TaxID=87958 RepID=A0AAN8J6P0_PATCE